MLPLISSRPGLQTLHLLRISFIVSLFLNRDFVKIGYSTMVPIPILGRKVTAWSASHMISALGYPFSWNSFSIFISTFGWWKTTTGSVSGQHGQNYIGYETLSVIHFQKTWLLNSKMWQILLSKDQIYLCRKSSSLNWQFSKWLMKAKFYIPAG